jgi:hypothetical protein
MSNKDLKKKMHKAISTLSVISGYVQLLNSKLGDITENSEYKVLAEKAQSAIYELQQEISDINDSLN